MNYVGKSHPIHDAGNKATGRATYAGDMLLPDMLYLEVLFSPIPHGYVKSIDTADALRVPGVADVIHCFNTTQNLFNRSAFTHGDDQPKHDGVFNSHVRFIGDRVACVIAESPQIAREALKLVRVEYEELPFSTDMREVLETGILDDLHSDGAVFGDYVEEIGDRSVLEKEHVSITSFSKISRINHIAMEPHACVAAYDRGLDELTVWSPNQSVFGIRALLGMIFEMPYNKIRVIKTTMGGSFGAKQEWMLEPVAAAAALRTGRPVKLVYTRAQTMVSTICRCPMESRLTAHITQDGEFLGFEADCTLDAGAYLGNSLDYIVVTSNKFFRVYSFPYLHYAGRAVCTNTPVSGAFRGWGTPELYIMLEHNINVAARRLLIDPLDLRLINAAKPEAYDPKYKFPIGPVRVRECLERGREIFEWDKKRAENKLFNQTSQRYRRGVGVGCGGHVNGYFPRKQEYACVEMSITETGDVLVNVTLHDHGCGAVTAVKIIVAETLGVLPDSVYVKEGDTAVTPMDIGCFASRTTYVLGGAAEQCAKKMMELMLANVAQLENVDASELVIDNAKIRSRNNPELCYSYSEAAVDSFFKLNKELRVLHQTAATSNPSTVGVHFALVEVDTFTGMTKILEYLAIHDVGKVINRELCIGQVQGAVLMGAGAALMEKCDVKPDGAPTASLKDYHIFNAFEAPAVSVEFIEDGGTEGPYGAKSIGEIAHVPVAPTIVGAVNDALDIEICDMPLDPEKVVKLLRERRMHDDA